MRVDSPLDGDLRIAGATARALEGQGFDGVWTLEGAHDPFLPLMLASQETSRVELGTGIAVAFARNPMILAQIGWDLQAVSDGRFVLGLGSQVKAHITRRFSMPWSQPAARMREFVLAIRQIWASWNDGTKLTFRGDFYQHTLMTSLFNPGPNPYGDAKIFVAGVGKRMTEVAGEVADGFLSHGFTTERYLREVTLPALERGAAKAGRCLDDIEISGPALVVTGTTEEEMVASVARGKQEIAFYASTPAYCSVLELHGWGGLHRELNQLSKEGRWRDMPELVDDDMLHAFAVVAEPKHLAAGLQERYGDIFARIGFYAPWGVNRHIWSGVMHDLREGR